MADTDDDQSVALEPEQREQGDDDTEAASERRAARARQQADERPRADLSLDEETERREEAAEQTRQEEADDQARAERLEREAKDQQELRDLRARDELLDATAETTRAFELAYADEVARDRYRKLAQGEERQAVSDLAHGRHELDEASAHPDAPGAAGLAADGRRYERASGIEDRRAESDRRLADRYDASAQDWHRREQPDPVEAVRNPPKEAPEAQLPQARRHVRGRVKSKNAPDRSTEPDLGLRD